MHTSILSKRTARNLGALFANAVNLALGRSILAAVALLTATLAHGEAKWEDIPAEDLAATESKSAPGSDMEILFARNILDSQWGENYLAHYVRVKIYTKKGVERQSIISFDANKHYKVQEVQARVVKPNGSVVDLKKEYVKVNSLVKKGSAEIKRTSFAFPDLQPGDVLEYRWEEGKSVGDRYSTNGFSIFCQASEIPTREWSFDVKASAKDYNVMWFNCPEPDHKAKSHAVVFHHLPPFVEEPDMPPEKAFRGWVLVLFTSPFLRYYNENSAWEEIGDYLAEDFRLETNPDRALKDKAAELTAGATSPEEQLSRLCRYCQTTITNLNRNATGEAADAKKKRLTEDDAQSASKTLSRRTGLPIDIQHLFAGLARAAGFEVRLALGNDRHEVLDFNTPRGWIFAERRLVAVKLGEAWKFYAPDDPYIEPGMLATNDEGAHEYVCDEKKSWFTKAQIALPQQTVTQRTGHFTLDGEGNLDGTVEIRTTGHRAYSACDRWLESSSEEITKDIRADLSARLPNAELSDITWKNLTDRSEPFTITYKVHVPGYADTIGSRLAVVPDFFRANTPVRFTEEQRRYPIFFDFAEQEHDKIEMVLPPDFELDGATAPAPVGKPGDLISAQYKVGYSPKTHTLKCQRDYTLGENGVVDFQVASYPVLRQYFSRIARSDTHQLVLKPKAAAPAEPAENPVPAATPASK